MFDHETWGSWTALTVLSRIAGELAGRTLVKYAKTMPSKNRLALVLSFSDVMLNSFLVKRPNNHARRRSPEW